MAIPLRLAILSEEYLHLMADPKENEEVNEELSTDELKDVSGGLRVQIESSFVDKGGEDGACLPSCVAQGSGSGKTKADFERDNKARFVADEGTYGLG